ncbi:MAG: VOC family protein [Dehalococcoidia bacterium]|nr:VOC family protein [Dehalococcoidia bacterium]
MGSPVVHFEINGRDGKKLHDFYSRLFGWKIDAGNPMNYGLVETDSGGHGINGGIGQSDQGNQVTFYVEVADPQAALNQIEGLGGRTIVPVTVIPNMVTFAQFADPEGNVVGLVKSEPIGGAA